MSNAKTKEIFSSQMIQNCLIRREMAKNKFGGSWRFSAVPTPFFFKVSKNLYQEKTSLFSYLCSEIKTKPKNHGLRQSCKTSPPPPPPPHNKSFFFFFLFLSYFFFYFKNIFYFFFFFNFILG